MKHSGKRYQPFGMRQMILLFTLVFVLSSIIIRTGVFAEQESGQEPAEESQPSEQESGEEQSQLSFDYSEILVDMPILEEDVLETQPLYPLFRAVNYPSGYDLREQSMITPIKDQASGDTCWAFASVAAMESSLLCAGETEDLSEQHLSYYFYHAAADPLQLTEGDRNIPAKNYFFNGGNCRQAALMMSGWVGPVREETCPYGSDMTTLQDQTFEHDYILEEACFIPYSVANVKKAISSGLAVAAMFNYDASLLNYETYGYGQADSSGSVNHAVLLVGWNDDFPADGFGEGSGVSQNGAWIAKNSWGQTWGDGGYFYLSYEDATLSSLCTFSLGDASAYDFNYHYDGAAMPGYKTLNNESRVAAVYTAAGAQREEIAAVSVVNYTQNVNYAVQIYVNGVDNQPDSGTPMLEEAQTGYLQESGIHTIVLDNPVEIKEGDVFSVVVSFSGQEQIRVGLSGPRDLGWVSFDEKVAPGQTFLDNGGTGSWSDASNMNSCVRLKAFTREISETPPDDPPEDNPPDDPPEDNPGVTVEAVSDLKAVPGGPRRVVLSWEDTQEADGWLIYGIKDGVYGYVGMSRTGPRFSDLNARDESDNYYWVYAYKLDEDGTIVPGPCPTFVKARGVCTAPAGLSVTTEKKLQLSWKSVSGAEGYLIYGIVNGKPYGYVGMTVSGTTFTVKPPAADGRNYYWVYAYHTGASGKMIPGVKGNFAVAAAN